MEFILRSANYNLVKATGGIEALKILKKNNNFDLILLDLMMPDMYGLNFLKKIKANPKLAKIPVILQTGTFDSSEIDKAFGLGIASYIQKPYNKQVVVEQIAKIFS